MGLQPVTATITVTPTVEAGNWPPRVRLDVAQSGSPAAAATTINRINPDGSLTPVRTSDGNPLPLSPIGLAYDYEMPYQSGVSYTTVESPLVVSSQVVVPESRVWLIHPGVPALSVPVGNFRPGTFTARTAPITQNVYVVMGRVNPVVWTDGFRKGLQSSMTVLAKTPDELDALGAVLADGSDLLLNIPTGLGYTMPSSYVAVGAASFAPVVDKVTEQWVDVTLPFQSVDRPVGGSQAQRTLADLIAPYPTLGDLKAAYPTLADLLSGP
jgi:hypothetical protein